MKYDDIKKMMNPQFENFSVYASMPSNDSLIEKYSIKADKIVKLNGNENPFGPHPKVLENIAKIPIHIYPDDEYLKSRQALAEYSDLNIDNIVVSCGSDELIDLLFRIFVTPGDEVLDFTPTFGMYSVRAQLAGAKIIPVKRDEDFNLNHTKIKEKINSKTKILFLASPNNPTGNESSVEDIEFLLGLNKILVIDEAYFEFSKNSYADLIKKYSNLIILRSMSKWAGLAGLRIGYGLMSKELSELTRSVKNPYNVSNIAEESLIISLKNASYLMQRVDLIIAEREKLKIKLEKLLDIKVYPSNANFLLCKLINSNLAELNIKLIKNGVFVRLFPSKELENCFRVSIGTADENEYFFDNLIKYIN